jgi:Signal transduction histidine kinase
MLRELIRNLLSNAVKYTPVGGKAGIEVCTDSARRVLITVWDSGPGMSAERLQAPFQPFVTSDQGQGAGLGLVICRDIALHLHAFLEIENRLGPDGTVAGLTVRFTTDRLAFNTHVARV